MDLGTFFMVILRGWWLIIIAVLITAGSSAYAVSQKAPIYRAVTTLEMRPSVMLSETRQIIDASNALERRTTINTAARRASSSSMKEQVAKALNVPLKVIQDADITSVVVPDTNYIEIRVLSTNSQLAAAIGNMIGEELRKLQPEKVFQIDIVDVAVPPTTPVEPQPVRVITLAVMFGLVLGIAFAMLTHFIERMRRESSSATSLVGEVRDGQFASATTVDGRSNPGQTQQFIT